MRAWLERQRYLVDYTVAALARRKAKNAALLAVYAAVVFPLASVMLFTEALRQEARLLLAGSPEVIVQRMAAGRHDLIPPDYLARMGRLRGVQQQQPRLWGYYYDPVTSANYTFLVPPAAEAPPAGHIVIGTGIARSRGAAVGDVMSFRSYAGKPLSFTIARLLPASSELVSADLLLLSEPDFRAFFGMPAGYYTDVALSVANPQEVRKVAQKVADRLPDARPILRDEMLRTYESMFQWREGVVLVLLTGAILAFAIIAWEKASGLSAEERREIGILKAIGWESGDVIRMKAWEGVLVSLTAFCLGYVLAYVHVFHLDGRLFEPVLKGWSVLYPRFRLVPAVDGFQLATLFFFTVFPYSVATIVPIWRAAVTDPDAVMRG
jgi:ABC-type lipoprotein release transport system permease subunit